MSVGFIFGVLLSSFVVVAQVAIVVVAFLAGFFWVVYLKNHFIKILTLSLLFFVAGVLYFSFQTNVPKDSRAYYDSKQEVQFFFELKNNLSNGLNNALLPPHSSLYKAILLGDKSEITYDMRSNLSHSGLSHIIAVSGLHIAILTLIIFWVLLRFLKRRYASLISLGILTFYILLIGAPASAVRAGIMVAVLILAQFIGRPNSALRALLYAASIMITADPVIVRFDIGFQLSFLAVLGILISYRSLDRFFRKMQYKIVEFILHGSITEDRKMASYFAEEKFGATGLLAVTISAQFFTAPLVFYYFDVFSFVSPVTNLLVVPILPLALVSGFAAAIFGALNFFPVILATPAWLFSSYIWAVVSFFGG